MTDLPLPQEPQTATAGSRRAGRVLWLAAALALITAGLVLWTARAEAIFTDMVSAAIAWCM